ncbi:MAG TPA: SRPBCC family protein [Candidatus Saccharimonadales bacterium]|nr:SRPBCC family protein [Candidatus Saccharimonadales bacterium]
MNRYVFSIFVAAPPERAFNLWIDLERMPEWVGGVSKVTDVTGPLDREGTSYMVWFGRTASRTEVLEVERPNRIRTRFGNWLLHGVNEATFQLQDGGTHLTLRFEPQGIVSAILARVFATGSYRGSFRSELASFARLAEGEVEREIRRQDG